VDYFSIEQEGSPLPVFYLFTKKILAFYTGRVQPNEDSRKINRCYSVNISNLISPMNLCTDLYKIALRELVDFGCPYHNFVLY
jgi:hypothetical protein